MREFIVRVLDTINKPNDELWKKRIGEFYVTAWNRLQTKLDGAYYFKELEISFKPKAAGQNENKDIQGFVKGTYPTSNTIKFDFIVDKSFIYSRKTKEFLEIRNFDETIFSFTYDSIPNNWILEKGGYLYKKPKGDEIEVFDLYASVLPLKPVATGSAVEGENDLLYREASYGTDLLLIADDYLYYEVCMKALLFLNEDLDRVSTFKSLRDEAFLDLQTHVNKLNDRGTLSIKG